MKELKILTVDKDEKKLRQISRDVTMEELMSDEFQEFLDDLVYTAQTAKLGPGWITAGLAAIQVDRPVKVIAIRDIDTDEYTLYINPEYEVIGDKYAEGLEGCLSIPGTTGYVIREKKIKIKYLDRMGGKHKERLSGWDARIFLHEYDHLIGVLFTDKLTQNANNS